MSEFISNDANKIPSRKSVQNDQNKNPLCSSKDILLPFKIYIEILLVLVIPQKRLQILLISLLSYQFSIPQTTPPRTLLNLAPTPVKHAS